MLPDDWRFDPTQLLGLVSFAIAAVACAFAALRAERSTVWRFLAGAQLVLLGEVLIGLRHRAHGVVDAALRANGLYETRSGLQLELLLGLLVTFAGLATLALRRRHHADGWAVVATLAAAALMAIEAVSLHRLDAFMYRTVGPFLAVSLGWSACAAAVALSALRAAPRAASP